MYTSYYQITLAKVWNPGVYSGQVVVLEDTECEVFEPPVQLFPDVTRNHESQPGHGLFIPRL